MPDDGRRYELLDGALVVTRHPTTVHQFVVMRLAVMLDAACPKDLCVLQQPAVQLTTTTEFDPDVVVVRLEEVVRAKVTDPPLLVVEVRSPSTALIDLNRKKIAYERFGVLSYWIVDPYPAQPAVTVFELRDGRYSTVAATGGLLTVDHPFKVTIDPAGPDQWPAPALR